MAKHLTREQLYELVWSKPTSEVAAQIGISDVAIGRRCKRLNVPKPPLGYWAKVAAGQKPEKPALPPGKLSIIALDAPFPKSLPLPEDSVDLHPVAVELRVALRDAKPDHNQFHKVEKGGIPRVSVSNAQIDRAAKAFHVILTNVESRGIPFRQSPSKWYGGYFQKGPDRFYVEIAEAMADREMTLQERRRGMWQEPKAPTGRLILNIKTEHYGTRDQQSFEESGKFLIDRILADVVQSVCKHFIKLAKDRAEAAERNRKAHEAWLVQEEINRKKQHEATLAATAHCRAEDLLKAAEWNRMHEIVLAFISACETRWRGMQCGTLTNEQETWLDWARGTARALSPFDVGYPDPARDGAFNGSIIPAGGPYPPKRDFPRPPTMPKVPPPVPPNGFGYGRASEPEPPSGLWLKHPNREKI